MKPFQLDTVLKYRRRLRDIAQNRFQEARNQFRLAQERVDALELEIGRLQDEIDRLQQSGIDIQTLIRYQDRLDFLGEQATRARQRAGKKQQLVVRERQHLLEKSKDHRVLEKLKERQNLQWRQFLDKKEAAMLDEIAVMQHRTNS